MTRQATNGIVQPGGTRPPEDSFPFEKEYARATAALNRTGILILLPRSGSPGVIGIDGKEYPVPTHELLQDVFARNKELVDRKMRQGFTQFRLTSIAMPASRLID